MEIKVLRICALCIKKYFFLIFLAITSFGLLLFLHQPIGRLPHFVHWDTIITLTGLLLITTAVKESGFFYLLAYRISRQISNERILSLFFVFISALLSMFFTNDIALFIIVPLTLCLQDISKIDYSKIIVFEAIAVNVGSALTPIGNPQNIFLWHQWGISFPAFVKEMAPFVFLLLAVLFLFTFFFSPSKKIKTNHIEQPAVDNKMFYLSAALLLLFIISIELEIGAYFLIAVFLLFFIFYRKIIIKADWALILLFIFIFIDINLISGIKEIQILFNKLDFNSPKTLFLSGAFLSQIISNVPAAILLSNYSANFKIIAYGVNVGGNGLLIASFANLIALNFIKERPKYLLFHLYSVTFFLLTLLITLVIFI
jgi:Na+/H+ antiporter NhaD/arsenite permease-like protein